MTVSTRERRNTAPILCGNCLTEIEHCDGKHGDWMHSATRTESCGHYATPETVAQYDTRTRTTRATQRQASKAQITNDPAYAEWTRRR